MTRYEFRYRLMPNTPENIVERWSTFKKIINSENLCNSKIEHIPTLCQDIVFQLVGQDRIDIDQLVVVRDTLKTVFVNHIGCKCVMCGMCFIT